MKAFYSIMLIAVLLMSTGCASQSGPTAPDPDSNTAPGNDLQGDVTYNQDEEVYLYFRSEAEYTLNYTFADIESLLANPLYTDEWEAEVVKAITHIYSICDEIDSAYVPDRFLLSHWYLTAAAEDYSLAMDYLLIPIPELAKARLQEGDKNWAESNRLLE